MYVPPLYNQDNPELIRSFIDSNSFGTVVAFGEEFPHATHVPIHFEKNQLGEEKLWTHFATANPINQLLEKRSQCTLIFQGPHAYISPSWYEEKNVPTWNYLAVHVRANARLMSKSETLELLTRLVKHHELPESDMLLEKLPKEYVQREMKGATAWEMTPISFHSQWKLSQNRNEKDHNEITEQLISRNEIGDHQISQEMKKNRNSNS
jgi:transcriptional regulator